MEKLGKNWWILLLEGMLFVFLGIMAIMLPLVSTLSFELVMGSVILIGGIMQLFRAIKFWKQELFLSSLLMGILSTVVGYYLLSNPLSGVVLLSIILLVFISFEGVLKIIAGLSIKPQKGWGWFLTSGLMSFVLVALALSNWPITVTWLIGAMLGINMFLFGSSMMFGAFGLRQIHHTLA